MLARFNDPAGRLWSVSSDPDGSVVFRIYNTRHKWRVLVRDIWSSMIVPRISTRLLSAPTVVQASHASGLRESVASRLAHIRKRRRSALRDPNGSP